MQGAVLRRAFPRIVIRPGIGKPNGRNSLLSAWVWSDVRCRAAIMAQEVFEYRWRWKAAGIAFCVSAAGILAISAYLDPRFAYLLPIALPLSVLTAEKLWTLLRHEALSHEIETQAAALLYGVEVTSYRISETHSLRKYAGFKGWTLRKLEKAMRSHTAEARQWVMANRSLLEKVKAA